MSRPCLCWPSVELAVARVPRTGTAWWRPVLLLSKLTFVAVRTENSSVVWSEWSAVEERRDLQGPTLSVSQWWGGEVSTVKLQLLVCQASE